MRILTATLATLALASSASAQTLPCNMSGYAAASGLSAGVSGETLTVTWDGDQNQDTRLRFAIVSGTPTIREIAVRPRGGAWKTVAANVTPDYRVVTGVRRVTEQQLQPLRQLKVDLTQSLVDSIKWDAFWDAPLNTEPLENTRLNAIPPPKGLLDQPGLPRKPEEIKRATEIGRAHV